MDNIIQQTKLNVAASSYHGYSVHPFLSTMCCYLEPHFWTNITHDVNYSFYTSIHLPTYLLKQCCHIWATAHYKTLSPGETRQPARAAQFREARLASESASHRIL